ncbi:sulfite exporter TauE/SafE family protein [Parasphaerochaeta coccoides]|uniref:sulfite exporter TauE/SafE family protein n=1 Tax=Parasphaerochaeta coccoides TaxID=273376 RepID=UPI00059DE3BA|nr:sulfite exporter TauE/SafE family protein [Parasphaerochaeta coccoides]
MSSVIVFVTFIATVIGSISGIGGGVIIKPVMDAVSGLTVSVISFLCGTTVLAMTSVALLTRKDGEVRVNGKIGTLLAIGSVLGGIIGKEALFFIRQAAGNDELVGFTQNIILVILTAMVFLYTVRKNKIETLHVVHPVLCLSSGLFLGLCSSFLGIGGGPVNIMILSYLFSMDSKHAALNSLFIIFFSQLASLAMTILTNSVPDFPWLLLILMIASGICGALLGRKVSLKLSHAHVDRLFMAVMVVIIGLSLYNVFMFGMGRK